MDICSNWRPLCLQISKDDFDSTAKALLGEGNVSLHNEFLFAILVKCQTGLQPGESSFSPGFDLGPSCLSPSSVICACASIPTDTQPTTDSPHTHLPPGRPKPKRQRLSPPLEPIPYGALDPLRYHIPPRVQLAGRDLDSLMLCSHELLLPDHATLHTRMLLGAWEAGLDGVAEDAAELLMLALEVST